MARHVTETKVQAFAHCVNSRCKGNAQAPVKALHRITELPFTESGGDMPGTERSSESVVFAMEKDLACPTCGGPRDVTMQERPVYANLSGHPQDGLLTIKLEDNTFVKPPEKDEEMAELRDQVAKLSELVASQATKVA